MNVKKIRIFTEFLIEQLNHWTIFPLALMIMGASREVAELVGTRRPDMLMWVICSLIPLVFFVFRCRITRMLTFVLLHLAVIAGSFLIPAQNITSRVLCVICAAGYTMYSFSLQIKHNTAYSSPIQLLAGVVISACAAMIQHYQGVDNWDNYFIFALISCVALFFIIFYLKRYLDFLSVNKSSTGHMPASEMLHSGLGLVLGYTLFGIVLLIISVQFEWLAKVLRPFKDVLIKAVRFILDLLLKFFRLFSRDSEVPIEGEEIVDTEGMLAAAEPFWIWRVLEYVAAAAIFCALFYVAWKLLLKLFRFLQEYFMRRTAGQEEGDEEAIDFRERCDLEKTSEKKKSDLFGFLSYREQVRRLYRKRVEVSAEKRPGYYTAREWEEKLGSKGMAEIYERARYTEREITGAEVKKMKEACKKTDFNKSER